jgi:cell shape-determining protein MreC
MGSKWRELMKERMVDMTLVEFKEAIESVTDVVKDLSVLRTENAQLKERVEFLEMVLLAMASKV